MKGPRRSKVVVPASVMLALAVLGAEVAVAAAPPSGNARAIAFYTKSRTAMAAYQGVAFIGGGTSYRVVRKTGYDSFKYDFGTTPPGYKTAIAHVQVVQSGGSVVEEVDTLKARGQPTLKLWQTAEIEVGEIITAHPCAEIIPKNSASFVTVGGPFVAFPGYHFAKLGKPSAAARVVSSSYPLAGGVAHQKDTISARTHLWTHSHLVVVGGPYNDNFLTEADFTYSRLLGAESPPALGRCG